MSENAKIGVFICDCGGDVSRTLSVGALVADAWRLPGVVWAGRGERWCLPGESARMRSIVVEENLSHILIAGCSPRTHLALFQRGLGNAIENPTRLGMLNIRDLCARPHMQDAPEANFQACAQIEMAVAELAARPLASPRTAITAPSVAIIGGGIAGMTAARAVADAGIPVTLVESSAELGALEGIGAVERVAAIAARENIKVLTNAQVVGVGGTVGHYVLTLNSGETITAGAIILATGAHGGVPSPTRDSTIYHYAFLLCDSAPGQAQGCSRTCCLAAVRQAIEIKRASPESQVTVLFRELYTAGGAYDDEFFRARQSGIRFIRYPDASMPLAFDGEIITFDELIGQTVCVPCDELITPEPMRAHPETAKLARMLHLTVDGKGFVPDVRMRLRPENRVDRGIYVCGAAHYPCTHERAMFEAHVAAARAIQHLGRGQITNSAPTASVDPLLCNGCGDCRRVCPFDAVTFTPNDGIGKIAAIDSLLCTGCGNCVSACPVKAATVNSDTEAQVEQQIRAALAGPPPHVLILACEWSGYAAAEMAGARGLQYSANVRILRLRCTGRLHPGVVLKALELGAEGVLVLGCAAGVCHYERGSEHAESALDRSMALAHLMGFGNRIAFKWVPPDDGEQFVQAVQDFLRATKVFYGP